MQTVKPSSSRLPLARTCPSSLLMVEAPVNSSNSAATMGTAVHHYCALMVMGSDLPEERLVEQYGVDAGEFGFLCAMARKAWIELAPHFPWARSEVEFDASEHLAETTADVVSASEDCLAVLDWKTGRVEKDHGEQLLGYLYAAAQQYGVRPKMVIATAWLRLGVYEIKKVTEQELKDFEERLIEYQKRAGKQYNPGEHCGFCPGKNSCVAFADAKCQALTVFGGGQVMSNEALAALYPQAKMLEEALESYKSMLRAALANGPLPVGDGRTASLVTVTKQEIDAQKAWPMILQAGLEEDDIAKCVSISKTALLKEIGRITPKGHKKGCEAQFMELLKSVGAVKESTFTKLEVSKGEAKQ